MILQRIGVPIYLQVKKHILDKIKAGEFRPGSKLPTERELAASLGISRNTVSAAYKELLLEDVLEARQGRGTFVKGAAQEEELELTGSKRERLAKIIDDALAKAMELGFTAEQFAAIAHVQAQARTLAVQRLRVAVVDCSPEFAHHFAVQINQAVAVRCEEVLLADIESGKVPIDLLFACDLVVTTVEHHGAVSRLMGSSSKLMVAAVLPRLDAVIQLARVPGGTAIGVIARHESYTTALERFLSRIHANRVQLERPAGLDNETLRQFIAKQTLLVVSEEMEQTVRNLALNQQEIVVFSYELDQGSLNQLMSRLIVTH